MRRTISLDGDWERRDFLDEAWRWSDALRADEATTPQGGPPAKPSVSAGWRPGRVPGSTLDDAWRAGEVPNPYVDRDSLAAEWVPQRTWVYRRLASADPAADERAVLRFAGLDPGGTVFLDGEEVARHDGMFVPLEVDLTGRMRPETRHRLVVVLDPAPSMPSQVGRSDLARHHRSRMGYGWDFCPRMIHTGIWRSVTLELFRARIAAVHPAVDVAPDHRAATIDVGLDLDGAPSSAAVTATLVDPDGVAVARATAGVAGATASVRLDVAAPRLWWPNGIGPADRYRLDVALEHGRDRLDERSVSIGLRSVALEPNEGAPPGARPYTLVVNGRRTWIRGWNWVPVDAAYGVPRQERVRHLVELARRANVNLLRVWGGGLIESESFHEACDAAGIMVWQEFSQSSSGVANAPPTDDAFVERMRREAEAIVPSLAHHPSLVLWCGGNELAGQDGPLDERHPLLAALADVVRRLDPGRAWLPTSPSGPRFDNSLAAIAEDPDALHDVHGPWEHQGLRGQHALADAGTSLLHSEFGTEGMTNSPTLAATVSERHREPADRSNPVMAHRGAWWNNEPFVRAAFGGGLHGDELARASQHLQADGLRTLVEGDRRRWPRNSGALPWVLNEPFPNAWSNAAVDYFGVPKAAYWSVAESYAPLAIGLAYDAQALGGERLLRVRAWVANEADAAIDGTLELSAHDAHGTRLADAVAALRADPNAVTAAVEIGLELADGADDLLVLAGRFAGVATRRILSRTDDLAPLRRLPAASPATSIESRADGWSVRLRNDGPTAAVEVRLDDARPVGWPERIGHAYLDANLMTLLPGEERAVGVTWHDVPAAERRLRLTGWNVAERVLTLDG